MSGHAERERPRRWWPGLLAGALTAGVLITGPSSTPENVSPRRPQSLRGERPRLVRLGPGGRLKAGPPEGWSHLVVKSIPALTSGDIASLPPVSANLAALFRTVIVADVRSDGTDAPPTLRRVGVGLAVPDQGGETIVTSEGLDQLGIPLSPLARLVLVEAERELARGRIVAQSPTFALFSTPVTMAVDGRHREVLLRYALLIQPETGTLDVGVWTIPSEDVSRGPVSEFVQLPDGLVFACGLDVIAHRILGRLPISWSFALTALPPGRSRPMPEALRNLAARDSVSPAEITALETGLRSVLADPAVADTIRPGQPLR